MREGSERSEIDGERPTEQPGQERESATGNSTDPGRFLLVGLASGVFFAIGLLVTESVGEIAVDVDLKPFFLPYLVIAFTRFGLPTLSAALGGALGEGVLDVFEGYELDDPFGFIGYVLGFLVFGWYLDETEEPIGVRPQATAAVLGAFAQAIFEGFAFFIFGSESTTVDAVVSVLGNTISHGIVLGAVPLVLFSALLREYTDVDRI